MRATIRVKPGSSRNLAGGRYGDDQLVVAVQAPAVDGRANKAVAKVLADALGIRQREVVIISGETARTKVVELPDGCHQALELLLGRNS